jgi:hypothetical protein
MYNRMAIAQSAIKVQEKQFKTLEITSVQAKI